jgi:hypothetical protein
VVPPAPAAETAARAAVETGVEETESQSGMNVGGWFLAGVGVLGLIGIVFLLKRRGREERLSILDRASLGSTRGPLTHGRS